MVNEPRDDDRTREESSFTKESETVTRDEDGVHTEQRYTKDTETTSDDYDGDHMEGYEDDARASDDGHPGLLWFSVAGAIIMGALWIIDITGVFGLDWPVMGRMTTLAIAILAAVGAVLFWYDNRKSRRTTSA